MSVTPKRSSFLSHQRSHTSVTLKESFMYGTPMSHNGSLYLSHQRSYISVTLKQPYVCNTKRVIVSVTPKRSSCLSHQKGHHFCHIKGVIHLSQQKSPLCMSYQCLSHKRFLVSVTLKEPYVCHIEGAICLSHQWSHMSVTPNEPYVCHTKGAICKIMVLNLSTQHCPV